MRLLYIQQALLRADVLPLLTLSSSVPPSKPPWPAVRRWRASLSLLSGLSSWPTWCGSQGKRKV